MNFFIKTLGCKVNQYESAVLSKKLENSGFFEKSCVEEADIVVINTCTVTENSDKKVKQFLEKLRERYPAKIIAVIGCFPQAFPEAAAVLGADIILGTSQRGDLPLKLSEFLATKTQSISIEPTGDVYEELSDAASLKNEDKTRATIKIEDGCNRRCAYCIIPKARGRVRSRRISDITAEVKAAIDSGHKEIVLAGINLSCYGIDADLTLCDAVEAVASLGAERIRLSSLEPDMMKKDVIVRLAAVPNLCPHFHLSLQSGSNTTLRKMNRLYTAEEFESTADLIRSNFAEPSLTTDIIVGFPGETANDFEESLKFVARMRFAKVHVFTYSPRAGTVAAALPDQIGKDEKTTRYKEMTKIAREAETAFLRGQIGKAADVLIEKRTSAEFLFGHSANYTPVKIYGELQKNAKRHDILKVVIDGTEDNCCIVKKGGRD